MKVAVFGGSGFVGSHIVSELQDSGHEVSVRSYRLVATRGDLASPQDLASIGDLIAGHEVVINAAGAPVATSADSEGLNLANAYFPGALARACADNGIRRFIHVSSASVQGDMPLLDESNRRLPFSKYSASKALGEELVERHYPGSVIYRPGGVHSADRGVTRSLRRVALSPLRLVASPGDRQSPQALAINVAAAVRYLTEVEESPPQYVNHPWEGLTTSDVVKIFGDRDPIYVPYRLAIFATRVGRLVGKFSSLVMANTRRAEMLLFGQGVRADYFDKQGWVVPHGREAWHEMTTAMSDTGVQ